MRKVVAGVGAILLLGMAAFCAFGFLAATEAGPDAGWYRLLYGVLGMVTTGGAVGLAWPSPSPHSDTVWRVLLWLARFAGTAAVVPLLLIVFGEPGAGPAGARDWLYLALFPFGFSAGYLLGWRRPLLAGCVSLACLAASLVVAGRVFTPEAYLIWGVLSLPGILYVLAGWNLRRGPALQQ